MSDSSWRRAVELTARFVKKPARLSHLLERLPESMDRGARRRCQYLLYGVVRNWSFLESRFDSLLSKRPRPGLWSALLVTGFELMQSVENGPKIVDHAVGEIGRRYSRPERGLANAVLRKASERMADWKAIVVEDVDSLAMRLSHPRWLVERWVEEFGFEPALSMAEWNGREPELYALPLREKGARMGSDSNWSPHRSLSGCDWKSVQEALDAGTIYIQNPGARLAPSMLVDRFESGRILDICAAPGGKSLFLDARLKERASEIVALDLPGPRMARLKENIQRFGSERLRAFESDLFEIDPQELGPFEAICLDAPCSNTGVMQRKPDAKWRLRAEDFVSLTELQLRMLRHASRFSAPGGWLLYSTCSIDGVENEGVASRFLDTEEGSAFQLVDAITSLPWKTGHDGAGARLFRRRPVAS